MEFENGASKCGEEVVGVLHPPFPPDDDSNQEPANETVKFGCALPPEGCGTTVRGTVKSFVLRKNYGFIALSDHQPPPLVFVHSSDIKNDLTSFGRKWKYFTVGDTVEFCLNEREGRKFATRVILTKKTPFHNLELQNIGRLMRMVSRKRKNFNQQSENEPFIPYKVIVGYEKLANAYRLVDHTRGSSSNVQNCPSIAGPLIANTSVSEAVHDEAKDIGDGDVRINRNECCWKDSVGYGFQDAQCLEKRDNRWNELLEQIQLWERRLSAFRERGARIQSNLDSSARIHELALVGSQSNRLYLENLIEKRITILRQRFLNVEPIESWCSSDLPRHPDSNNNAPACSTVCEDSPSRCPCASSIDRTCAALMNGLVNVVCCTEHARDQVNQLTKKKVTWADRKGGGETGWGCGAYNGGLGNEGWNVGLAEVCKMSYSGYAGLNAVSWHRKSRYESKWNANFGIGLFLKNLRNADDGVSNKPSLEIVVANNRKISRSKRDNHSRIRHSRSPAKSKVSAEPAHGSSEIEAVNKSGKSKRYLEPSTSQREHHHSEQVAAVSKKGHEFEITVPSKRRKIEGANRPDPVSILDGPKLSAVKKNSAKSNNKVLKLSKSSRLSTDRKSIPARPRSPVQPIDFEFTNTSRRPGNVAKIIDRKSEQQREHSFARSKSLKRRSEKDVEDEEMSSNNVKFGKFLTNSKSPDELITVHLTAKSCTRSIDVKSAAGARELKRGPVEELAKKHKASKRSKHSCDSGFRNSSSKLRTDNISPLFPTANSRKPRAVRGSQTPTAGIEDGEPSLSKIQRLGELVGMGDCDGKQQSHKGPDVVEWSSRTGRKRSGKITSANRATAAKLWQDSVCLKSLSNSARKKLRYQSRRLLRTASEEREYQIAKAEKIREERRRCAARLQAKMKKAKLDIKKSKSRGGHSRSDSPKSMIGNLRGCSSPAVAAKISTKKRHRSRSTSVVAPLKKSRKSGVPRDGDISMSSSSTQISKMERRGETVVADATTTQLRCKAPGTGSGKCTVLTVATKENTTTKNTIASNEACSLAQLPDYVAEARRVVPAPWQYNALDETGVGTSGMAPADSSESAQLWQRVQQLCSEWSGSTFVKTEPVETGVFSCSGGSELGDNLALCPGSASRSVLTEKIVLESDDSICEDARVEIICEGPRSRMLVEEVIDLVSDSDDGGEAVGSAENSSETQNTSKHHELSTTEMESSVIDLHEMNHENTFKSLIDLGIWKYDDVDFGPVEKIELTEARQDLTANSDNGDLTTDVVFVPQCTHVIDRFFEYLQFIPVDSQDVEMFLKLFCANALGENKEDFKYKMLEQCCDDTKFFMEILDCSKIIAVSGEGPTTFLAAKRAFAQLPNVLMTPCEGSSCQLIAKLTNVDSNLPVVGHHSDPHAVRPVRNISDLLGSQFSQFLEEAFGKFSDSYQVGNNNNTLTDSVNHFKQYLEILMRSDCAKSADTGPISVRSAKDYFKILHNFRRHHAEKINDSPSNVFQMNWKLNSGAVGDPSILFQVTLKVRKFTDRISSTGFMKEVGPGRFAESEFFNSGASQVEALKKLFLSIYIMRDMAFYKKLESWFG